jgi:hypothetical protein
VNATDGGKCANGVRQSALKAQPTSRTRFTIQSNGMSGQCQLGVAATHVGADTGAHLITTAIANANASDLDDTPG